MHVGTCARKKEIRKVQQIHTCAHVQEHALRPTTHFCKVRLLNVSPSDPFADNSYAPDFDVPVLPCVLFAFFHFLSHLCVLCVFPRVIEFKLFCVCVCVVLA